MIVCELEPGFNTPDQEHPEYAFPEIDVFARNPAKGPDGNYRLSIRRNLSLDRWELFRHYHGNGSEVVEAFGTLKEVLLWGNHAWTEAWGPGGRADIACDHVCGSSDCSSRCGKPREQEPEVHDDEPPAPPDNDYAPPMEGIDYAHGDEPPAD